MKVEERFLKYISICTTSDENSSSSPSTNNQFVLAKILESELNNLGLQKVILTENCYVYGLLPATSGMESKKSVGFISHMDTSPDYSGLNIRPQIITDYNGNDIPLKGSHSLLKVEDFPSLSRFQRKTLITTDGTTLLGADDKAGISEIITALEQIISENIPHGDIWIAFTPDEEIGRGADLFDLDYFKADFAFTVDGDYEGEVAYENFNAASAVFSINGINVHPGEAKDIMINASLVGCEIANMLPEDEVPSKTEGYEGFFHLTDFSGNVSHATLEYIVRDHNKDLFESKLNLLRTIEVSMNQKYGSGTVSLDINYSYENMISVIEDNIFIIELAKKAISENGLTPVSNPVRGGTDGARLSFMGLPCPNLGTGGYGFHGPFEHICVESMETVVSIIKSIVKLV